MFIVYYYYIIIGLHIIDLAQLVLLDWNCLKRWQQFVNLSVKLYDISPKCKG